MLANGLKTVYFSNSVLAECSKETRKTGKQERAKSLLSWLAGFLIFSLLAFALLFVDALVQPGPCQSPQAVGGASTHAESFGRPFGAESPGITERHQLGRLPGLPLQ